MISNIPIDWVIVRNRVVFKSPFIEIFEEPESLWYCMIIDTTNNDVPKEIQPLSDEEIAARAMEKRCGRNTYFPIRKQKSKFEIEHTSMFRRI